MQHARHAGHGAPLSRFARPARPTHHAQSSKCIAVAHFAHGQHALGHVQSRECIALAHFAHDQHALRQAGRGAPLSRFARPGRPTSAMTLTAARAACPRPYASLLLVHKQHEQSRKAAACSAEDSTREHLAPRKGTSQSLGQAWQAYERNDAHSCKGSPPGSCLSVTP